LSLYVLCVAPYLPQLVLYRVYLVVYERLLVVESHICILGICQRVGVGDFDVDEVMILAIVLSQACEDTLGAVGILAAEAIELILASRVLVTEAIVLASLVDVDPFVQAHDASHLVLKLVTFVDSDVALVAEVGTIVLTVLSGLIATGDTVLDLRMS
jgi:hypothetical protein